MQVMVGIRILVRIVSLERNRNIVIYFCGQQNESMVGRICDRHTKDRKLVWNEQSVICMMNTVMFVLTHSPQVNLQNVILIISNE